ncbi:MAG TPA: dethiobiotin synthase, partial [Puia sp.]|nr:dethiobiotin synthase [Puia sp.]
EWIFRMVTNATSIIHPEIYRFRMPASPHIAARAESERVDLEEILRGYRKIASFPRANNFLVIEGAGGLMVPLNDDEFVLDLLRKWNAKVVIVSRNYLGSINHSLLTAKCFQSAEIPVMGWIFNDQYLDYEDEIVQWTSIPKIASIPFCKNPGKAFIVEQARLLAGVVKKNFPNDVDPGKK